MFALRFDIDSHYGLTRRLRPLLEVLRGRDTQATFFCVMGRDASLAEILALRILARRRRAPAAPPQDSAARAVEGAMHVPIASNLPKILHTLTFPRRVGSAHPALLREVVAAGHEVYPHGWSHIQWQRNIDRIDVRAHLQRCISAHRAIFGAAPRGFGSPGRVYNETALALFDELGFDFVGDMDGDQPFTPPAHRCLQIPVTLFKTIAQLAAQGLDRDGIIDCYFRHVTAQPFAVLYEHPDNLGAFELEVLDGLLARLAARAIKSTTFSAIHRAMVARN